MSGQGDFGTPATQQFRSLQDSDNFSTLSDNARGKIFLLNKNISKLESLSKSLDSPSSEKELESKAHALFQETNKLANTTKDLFKQTTKFTRAGPGRYDNYDNKSRRYNLEVNKLQKEFENSLSRYYAIQNVIRLKIKANIEQEGVGPPPQSSTQHQQHDILIDTNDESLEQALIQDDKLNEQVQLEADVASAKEREMRLRQIEEDVLNVNEIFQDLAVLVHDQGQVVDSIESNIEQAHAQVGEGNKALRQAVSYQKSYRKRICKITVIVLVVVLVLSLIIYYGSKD